MKVLLAIVLGLLSGFMIYFGAAMLFTDFGGGEGPSTTFVVITFIGGWLGSTYIMQRGAKSISKVFSRGFLIGAAEWLAMIPIGIIFGGKAVVATEAETGAESAGAIIGGGMVAFLTGGIAIAMALACMIGFAITYFIGQEMKPEDAANTKKCPQCAEMIKPEALKCCHCGCNLEQAT